MHISRGVCVLYRGIVPYCIYVYCSSACCCHERRPRAELGSTCPQRCKSLLPFCVTGWPKVVTRYNNELCMYVMSMLASLLSPPTIALLVCTSILTVGVESVACPMQSWSVPGTSYKPSSSGDVAASSSGVGGRGRAELSSLVVSI